jgi:hypothetical protein
MDEDPSPGYLVVRARSEPAGIEIDWQSDLPAADLAAACAAIESFFQQRSDNRPKLSTSGLPDGHPHQQDLQAHAFFSDEPVRFIEVTLRDNLVAEMFVEPSASERAEGASIIRKPMAELMRGRFRVHRYASGMNSPTVRAQGRPVPYRTLAASLLAELRRRGR